MKIVIHDLKTKIFSVPSGINSIKIHSKYHCLPTILQIHRHYNTQFILFFLFILNEIKFKGLKNKTIVLHNNIKIYLSNAAYKIKFQREILTKIYYMRLKHILHQIYKIKNVAIFVYLLGKKIVCGRECIKLWAKYWMERMHKIALVVHISES